MYSNISVKCFWKKYMLFYILLTLDCMVMIDIYYTPNLINWWRLQKYDITKSICYVLNHRKGLIWLKPYWTYYVSFHCPQESIFFDGTLIWLFQIMLTINETLYTITNTSVLNVIEYFPVKVSGMIDHWNVWASVYEVE